ncbi:chitooligosaccharide deacetylase [Ampelomyces quisqualis]|uniref:chitin deacetylase n=1 Tax=Ampelomyces quisqualis TaxID=50730 RepID=A0A6A5R4V5_AMPQU|nr:chitooligosaccharide deacetylase [Ampelomyces quisqualis]
MYRRLFRLPPAFRRRARRTRLFTMFIALLTLLTFVTPFYVIYKPPILLIRYLDHRWPDALWHVPVKDKIVALTIDDAPSQYTADIVDVLKENEAKATFFVIGGQVKGREQVLESVVSHGNELGNHAMHDEPSRSLSPQQLSEQLVEVESYINNTYASVSVQRPPTRFFRPGSGLFSSSMRQQIKAMGYRMVLGSVYPHDAQISYSTVNARHILSMVRPGGIIICHDRRSWTVPMLRTVLPELKRRGYTVTTVQGLLAAKEKEMVRSDGTRPSVRTLSHTNPMKARRG